MAILTRKTTTSLLSLSDSLPYKATSKSIELISNIRAPYPAGDEHTICSTLKIPVVDPDDMDCLLYRSGIKLRTTELVNSSVLSQMIALCNNQIKWVNSYEDRIVHEIKQFFQYIEYSFTDEHEAILRDCIKGYQRKYYTRFTIKKKSGGERVIEAPCDALKYLQKTLLDKFLTRAFMPYRNAKGFVKGVSIVDAANRVKVPTSQMAERVLLKIDFKDFFPSISETAVNTALMSHVISTVKRKANWCFWQDILDRCGVLNDKGSPGFKGRLRKYAFKRNIFKRSAYTFNPRIIYQYMGASSLTLREYHVLGYLRFLHLVAGVSALACIDNRLPQGSPLSPAISNLVLKPLDMFCGRIENRNTCAIMRYADDICVHVGDISTACKIKEVLLRYIRLIPGLEANPKKVKLIRHGKPMRVVGLNINTNSPSFSRYKRKNVEAMLFNLCSGKHAKTEQTMRKIAGYRALFSMNYQWSDKCEQMYSKLLKMS